MPLFEILGKSNYFSVDVGDGGSFPFGSGCARWGHNECISDGPARHVFYSNHVRSGGVEISETIPGVGSWVSVETENTSDSDDLVSDIGDVIIQERSSVFVKTL